jgi:hypothetical protein
VNGRVRKKKGGRLFRICDFGILNGDSDFKFQNEKLNAL